jgi:hypothetical protein
MLFHFKKRSTVFEDLFLYIISGPILCGAIVASTSQVHASTKLLVIVRN